MGILTIISPKWLVDLSNPGKNVEAITIKNAGDAYLKSGKYLEAIQQYNKALKIVPDLKSAMANLAISYQKTGNFSKAVSSFNQLLNLDPEYPEVIYYNLGELYEKTGQPDKALKNYLLSAKTSANPESSFQKAGYICMEKKEWNKAILYFKLAIKNRRSIENSYKEMLIIHQKAYSDTSYGFKNIQEKLQNEDYLTYLNDYDEVIFNEQLSTDIDLAKTYNNTGYCLALLEKYEEAVFYLETAIKINPTYTEARNNLKVVESFISEKQ